MAESTGKLEFKGSNGNGHGNGNGNGHSKWRVSSGEIGGFWVAEAGGATVTLGAMYLMQMLPKSIMDPITDIGGKLLEPVTIPLEKALGFVCKLDECKPDQKKTVAQRAKDYARIATIAIPPIILSWYAKIWTRRKFNESFLGLKDSHKAESLLRFWKWSPEEKMLAVADEGMHIASILAVQSAPVAPYTDKLIVSMTDTFEKLFGWKHEEAHEAATMVALHEIPNVVGGLSAAAAIVGRHHYNWPSGWVGKLFGKKEVAEAADHVGKLAAQSAHSAASTLQHI